MKVLVLMGGPSAERKISLATGRAVADALRSLGHEVSELDPAPAESGPHGGVAGSRAAGRDGSHTDAGTGDRAAGGLDSSNKDAGVSGSGAGNPARRGSNGGREPESRGGGRGEPGGLLSFIDSHEFADCDAVFVALHGEFGEDGKIQAVLDLAGVPYTGSGALASALSMNKHLSKKVFLSQGIPTPEWIYYSASDGGPSAKDRNAADSASGQREGANGIKLHSRRVKAPDPSELASLGGFPVVVKPNNQGSTIGLSVVVDEAGLTEAFDLAAGYSDEIIVERYIPGRELTVSILDAEALPVVEIIPKGGLYDYRRKYTKGESRYVVPAELDRDLGIHVRELGLRCFNALGCRGFGRVDMRLSPENEVFCLEVNTIPGMTEMSLVPMAAKAVGISFEQLVERILASATLNGPRRRGGKWA